MSTTRFKSTLDAIKGGVKSFTVDKATTNIEGWEDYLSKHDHEGVKKVVADLAKLKKLLHAKELDGEAIKKLVSKLGKDTVAVAGEEHNANANHIRELGEALSQAADSGEEDSTASEGKTEKDAEDSEESEEKPAHKKAAHKKAE